MKNVSQFFEKTFDQKLYELMLKVQKDRDLTDKLLQMQLAQDVDPQEAEQNVEACIKAAVTCESVHGRISEDAPAAMQEFFHMIAQDQDRELILLKLLFGLTAYKDEAYAPQLCNGVSREHLFYKDYYPKNAGTRSEEQLEQEVLDALNTYAVTDEVIEAFVRRMQNTGNYLATVDALGAGGIHVKCIMTMDAYLESRNKGAPITMEEAAKQANCAAEVQGTAHGLGERMLRRDVAKKILIAAGITVAVVAAGYALYHAGAAAGFMKAAAAAKDVVYPVPEIFKDIASMGGARPAVAGVSAKVFAERFLADAALAKKLSRTGYALSLAGVAGVALSQKTADFIGGLNLGFTRDHKSHIAGLQSLKGYAAEKTAEHSCKQTYTDVPVKKIFKKRNIARAFK